MKRTVTTIVFTSLLVIAGCHAKPKGPTTGDGISVDANASDDGANAASNII